MRKMLLSLMLVVFFAPLAMAAPGESWILLIHHRDEPGNSLWVQYPGAGYNGTDAWGRDSWAGDWRRLYWELSGVGSMGNEPATSARLYRIEFFYPTAGSGDWQPIESQFGGAGGEQWPIDTRIPWVGAFGTNHQWIGSEFIGGTPGTWVSTGPGPHTPDGAAYLASPNGTTMWLARGSWLYAKWDFGWEIDRAWSALRLTQACATPQADLNGDNSVDGVDYGLFASCFNGTGNPINAGCECADLDADNSVDGVDYGVFASCFNGTGNPPSCLP